MITTPRNFPSVEELLQSSKLRGDIASVPRPIAATVVKTVVARLKQQLSRQKKPLPMSALINAVRCELGLLASRSLSRVINATGVVVHTNLGRSPLGKDLSEVISRAVDGYSNIEYDLVSGSRGHRGAACEQYLARLSGAEEGTVVNNCAAALFVILNTLANRKKVIISRGELVQIGGGFRIPDILRKSGARMSEVGTTNITTLADYEKQIDEKTALILKVHKSNFVQTGFTDEVPLKSLVALGRKHGIPVVNDLGSGVFVPTRKILGYSEPTVQSSVRAGADLTCFSGDKMLGGIQAGLIVGHADLVTRIKKNPIFRTLRVDKIVFSVLEKLIAIYLNGTQHTDIKLWQILTTPTTELHQRATSVHDGLGNNAGISVEKTRAFVGGGALPEQSIDSTGLVFSPEFKAEHLMERFRACRPPIIGRVDNDRFILDLKAVDTSDLPVITKAIKKILG